MLARHLTDFLTAFGPDSYGLEKNSKSLLTDSNLVLTASKGGDWIGD